jgi:DNA-binding transcriptional LysR family regulator
MSRLGKIERLATKDLNLLVVFRAVAETGSVSSAADHLALSQPAVSHALNRLRQSLNDPLFVRGRDGLSPTPFAQSIMVPVRDALAQIESIFEKPTFDPAKERRRFRIAASDFTAATLLAPLLQELSGIAPGISLDVRGIEGNIVEQLDDGSLELAFAVQPSPPPHLRYIELLQDRFVGVLHKRHPLAPILEKRALKPEDYLQYPHVAISVEATRESERRADRNLVDLADAREIRAWFPNFVSGLASLVDTEFIMTVPARLGSRFIELFELLQFELPVSQEPQPYYLLWHKRTDQDPGLEWLRALIAGHSQYIGRRF